MFSPHNFLFPILRFTVLRDPCGALRGTCMVFSALVFFVLCVTSFLQTCCCSVIVLARVRYRPESAFPFAAVMEIMWPLLSETCVPACRGCFAAAPKTAVQFLCDDCGIVTDFLVENVFLCAVCFRKMRWITRQSVCAGKLCYQLYSDHLCRIQRAGGAVEVPNTPVCTKVAESAATQPASGLGSSDLRPPGIEFGQQHCDCVDSGSTPLYGRYTDTPMLLQPRRSVVATDYAAFVSLPSPSPLPWTQSAGTRQQIADLFALTDTLVSEVSKLKAGIHVLQDQLRLLTYASHPKSCLSTARSTDSLLVRP